MQWMKRFWDTNYPGHPYDPVARRRGQSTETPATLAPITSARSVNTPGAPAPRSGGKTPVGGHRTGSASAANHEQVLGLQVQLKEMSAHLEGLEKERDFYFAKVYLLPCSFLPWSGLLIPCSCFIATRYRDLGPATNRRSRKGRSRGYNTGRDSENFVLHRGTSFFKHPWHHLISLTYYARFARTVLRYQRVERRRAMRRRRFRRAHFLHSHIYEPQHRPYP